MSDTHQTRSVAEKLQWLFDHVLDEHGRPYTAADIAHRSGVSESQIKNLLRGRSDNPTLRNLEAICRAFGVTTQIFLAEDGIEQTAAELALLAALQRADIRDLALRAHQMNPDAVRQLTRFIESLRSAPRVEEGKTAKPE